MHQTNPALPHWFSFTFEAIISPFSKALITLVVVLLLTLMGLPALEGHL